MNWQLESLSTCTRLSQPTTLRSFENRRPLTWIGGLRQTSIWLDGMTCWEKLSIGFELSSIGSVSCLDCFSFICTEYSTDTSSEEFVPEDVLLKKLVIDRELNLTAGWLSKLWYLSISLSFLERKGFTGSINDRSAEPDSTCFAFYLPFPIRSTNLFGTLVPYWLRVL